MIGNPSDQVSGSWERNESAQGKGDDNHGKRSGETIEFMNRGKRVI